MFLLLPNEFPEPILGNVKLATLPALSKIFPVSALTDVYSKFDVD